MDWSFLQKNMGTGPALTINNPATGENLQTIVTYTREQAQKALEKARAAQRSWAALPITKRIKILRRFQHLLVENTDEFCELLALENGKPFQEALQTEIIVVDILAGYFLKRGPALLADREIPMHLLKYRRSYINYRPRGVVYVISPWNYPFSIPGGTVFMALLAGNAVVQKPASLTPLIALKTKDLFDQAGLDPDLYQVLPCPGAIGSQIIDMGVDFVNFTGSTQVGLEVAQKCARHLIPCSMELGGKDPLIVCPDADINRAAAGIIFGALTNAGQTCASVERVYAHKSVYRQLVDKVAEQVSRFRLGDPLTEITDMGPMVDPNQIPILEDQLADARQKGANILCGGKRWDGPGQFFEPTVLVDVTDDMKVMREETFGPFIPIMKVDTLEQAVRKANDSIYGLNAYIYTEKARTAKRLAHRLEAGTVMVNETLITFGLPETPWQGVKMSGTGRTHSDEGLLNMCYPYHINEDALLKVKLNPFQQPYSPTKYKMLKWSLHTLYGDWLAKRLNFFRDKVPFLKDRS